MMTQNITLTKVMSISLWSEFSPGGKLISELNAYNISLCLFPQINTNCEIVNPGSYDGSGVGGEDRDNPPVVRVGEHIQAPARHG